jgi:broad specificity phosphatase PhoE
MELYLIRHGESTNNALPDESRRVADPLLTPLGERQAERVATFIESRAHLHPLKRDGVTPLDRLYSSAMLRAMQTANAIGRRIGLAPELWLDVHEFGGIYLDHGEQRVGYAGATRSDLARRFPHFLRMADVGETGWWNRPHEARADGVQRALRVAQALRERAYETTRIGIVSHGDFLSSLMHALLAQADGAVYYEHRNAGVTCMELTPEIVRVRYLNRADHLDAEFD